MSHEVLLMASKVQQHQSADSRLLSKLENTQHESIWTLTIFACADPKCQVHVKYNRSHKATDQQTERSDLAYLLDTIA